MIHVTKTYLPPIEDYQKYVAEIWQRGQVTNNGPLVRELEEKLKEFLGVKHLFFCTNGTIVIQLALKVLGITKEVITTPFSYCATATAPLWENCKPVMADILSTDYCIDPLKVEQAINENTQAIIATHVFGNPCKLDALQNIAQKHNLKLIYDAAHAFGVSIAGKSLLSFGDISTCSFHATKVFHTIEGGCIITDNDEYAKKISLYRSFGHVNDDYFSMGINAKNSEFHAAMGLCVLPNLESIIKRRKEVSEMYDSLLIGKIIRPEAMAGNFEYNYAYYPVIFDSEEKLLKVKKALEDQQIYPRRYFYPSLNTLNYIEKTECDFADNLAPRVLCLPLFYEITDTQVQKISNIVLNCL